MARIRTIKPEAFTSETLAAVSLTAERTFFGLLTQADDQGRHRDHAAIITGVLWPLRPEHTPIHVEEDLQQLAAAGLICRYTACDGRTYLHVVTWARHQKIDRPSRSRLPACLLHNPDALCGVCQATPCTEATAKPVRGLGEGSSSPHPRITEPSAGSGDPAEASSPVGDVPGQAGFDVVSSSPHRTLQEASVIAVEGATSGSWTMDRGSTADAGRQAPGQEDGQRPGTQEMLAEYVTGCRSRPPAKVLSHLGREVRELLAEGVDPSAIRTALSRFRNSPKHPSVLPSLVNEVLNGGVGRLERPNSDATVTGQAGWTVPTDPAAYAEEL
ncbi:hypothetical protein [Streptomyces hainanensis]|uniref:Phage or prophage related protein n=1 Tax=Streptomyces hainanensis TaxID=402648 RepID=A0A4R4TNN2_9ACTN|nr:hypothetical protein [Streptomyces hainanensis]TDC75689.1 hypothetical protein E1283_11645 [Streptomyces hainanensis]